ncbi:related to C6 transcription factor [Cephalotrichum gorgonifer]|uniref:Related to C6 transcription factor n=1 Tax=Cephalotrichum gorgonifer TaxID=2041049 RepID=A0AAE8N6X7_9PEZI|nr:related to C6 transcription factor [Cephalotrichum gorgonifer]
MSKSRADAKERACDACYKRKIQCDAAPSQCNWCKHHGLVCTFDRPYGRRKRTRNPDPTGGYIRQSGTDETPPVKKARGLAFPKSSSPDVGSIQSAGELAKYLPDTGLGGFYFDGLHLGGISSSNGIPFFSKRGYEWIRARVGSATALPKAHTTPPPWQQTEQGQQGSARIDGSWQFPDRSIVEMYRRVFFQSSLSHVFPIIDDTSFTDIIDRAYDVCEDALSLDGIRAKACVLSFLSVLIHMEGKLDSNQSVDGDQCAARAQDLMPQVLAEAHCESVQVCAMLAMHNLYSGNTMAAATFLSIACRFALMLGAHMEPATPGKDGAMPPSNHLRRLFWLCYMFDKDICLRAGYPPVIDDDHCDLSLPQGYKQIDDFNTVKDDSDHFPGDMRLSIIKSQAIRSLYCRRAFRKSDAELLRDIRELDNELETWRTAIPPLHRPTLAPAYRLHLDSAWNKGKKVHLIVIHLEYYFLLALIHSAGGRCRAWAGDEGDQVARVTSSQALALQASRSTIVNLSAAAHVFNCGDFWFFVLYPVYASLTIFCNILLSPLNPQAEGDTRLLLEVPGLIKGMRTHRLDTGDRDRVGQVEEFILELVRLAKCAMANARQKRI